MRIALETTAEADLAEVRAIYAPAVTAGTASFEEEVPSLVELDTRRRAVAAAGLPYLVARSDGDVVGFAYAGPFRARPAYRHTVETSVYVAGHAQRQGVGTALLEALLGACAAVGRRQAIAVIGDPDVNRGSIALHERLGFRPAGRLCAVGWKFGRPLDIALLQRSLDG